MLVCEGINCFNQVSMNMHFDFRNYFLTQNCFYFDFSYQNNSAGIIIELASIILNFNCNTQ